MSVVSFVLAFCKMGTDWPETHWILPPGKPCGFKIRVLVQTQCPHYAAGAGLAKVPHTKVATPVEWHFAASPFYERGWHQPTPWVIIGGPRCGPCFRLAHWTDRHHEVLEKDYVIVKLGLEPHADSILTEIGGAYDRGIPWFAITEPDGKILVTCEGPLGNIGMPGGVEGLRHFRKMLERTTRRISAEEIDKLIQSLHK
jgi:hypothetical protein